MVTTNEMHDEKKKDQLLQKLSNFAWKRNNDCRKPKQKTENLKNEALLKPLLGNNDKTDDNLKEEMQPLKTDEKTSEKYRKLVRPPRKVIPEKRDENKTNIESIKNRHSNYRAKLIKQWNANKDSQNHGINNGDAFTSITPAADLLVGNTFENHSSNHNIASNVEQNFNRDNNGTNFATVNEAATRVSSTPTIFANPLFQEATFNFLPNYDSMMTGKISNISHNTDSSFDSLNNMASSYNTAASQYSPKQNDFQLAFPQNNPVIPTNDYIHTNGYLNSFTNNSFRDIGFDHIDASARQNINCFNNSIQNFSFIPEANNAQTISSYSVGNQYALENRNFVQEQNLNSFNTQSLLPVTENQHFVHNKTTDQFIFNDRTVKLPYEGNKSTISPAKLNNSNRSTDSTSVDIQFGLNLSDQEMSNILRIASLNFPDDSFSQIPKVDGVPMNAGNEKINAPVSPAIRSPTHRRVNVMQNYKKVADVANASIENVAQQLYHLNQINKRNENVDKTNDYRRKGTALHKTNTNLKNIYVENEKKHQQEIKRPGVGVTLSYDTPNALTIKVKDDCFINFDDKSNKVDNEYYIKPEPIVLKEPPAVGILKKPQYGCFTLCKSENQIQFHKNTAVSSSENTSKSPGSTKKRVSFVEA